MKSFKEFLNLTEAEIDSLFEASNSTVNVDWYGDVRNPAVQKELRKHKLTVKLTGKDSADLTGSKANLAKYLHTVHHSREYDSAAELVDDMYPELNENLREATDATVNVDWYGDVRDPVVQKELRKHKLTVKLTGKDSADLTGSKANLAKYLHTVHHRREYDSAQDLVDDMYPELG